MSEDVEFSKDEAEALKGYMSQFDALAEALLEKLEADRKEALCKHIVSSALLAVHLGPEGGVDAAVVEFIELIFSRCNINIIDERRKEKISPQ